MAKRYKTRSYSLKNHQKRLSPTQRMLKLNDKDKLKELSNYFSGQLKGKIVQNMTKSFYKIEQSKLTDFFKNHTVQFWKKKSGIDYTEKLKADKKLLRTDKGPIKDILLDLLKVTGFNGKLKTSTPFVLNEYQYKFLRTCPKEVIGEHIIKTPSNKLIIRHLLQGTFKEETYLFFSDILLDQNRPAVSFGLNFLVNGLPSGVKPLFRYDSCGFLPLYFLKKHNIPLNFSDQTREILENNFVHTNALSKHVKDAEITNEETSHVEHMHKSTYYQDIAFAAAHYFISNLSLRCKINSSHTSTVYTDLYEALTEDYKQKENLMLNDAMTFNGMVPIQRIVQYGTKQYNFKLNSLTPAFFNLLNQVRQPDSNLTFPTAEEILSNTEFVVQHKITRVNKDDMENHVIGKRFLEKYSNFKEDEEDQEEQEEVQQQTEQEEDQGLQLQPKIKH